MLKAVKMLNRKQYENPSFMKKKVNQLQTNERYKML